MLTVSSISSPVPAAPVAPVSRPALVAEAVRSASPLAEIQPSSAISRERSRVESKIKDAAASPALLQQAQAEQVTFSQDVLAKRAQAAQPARGSSESAGRQQPPVEKNPIQKALEQQIKNVLDTVWKASGRAVDFLLGRQESLMEKTLSEVLLPEPMKFLPDPAQPPRSAKAAEVVSYTKQGGSDNAKDPRGQLLDTVA